MNAPQRHAMRQLHATGYTPEGERVELLLDEYVDPGYVPDWVMRLLPWFRQVWVTDRDGVILSVVKDNLGTLPETREVGQPKGAAR